MTKYILLIMLSSYLMKKVSLRVFFPDIIVHSRGKVPPDNLLAHEMKKSIARREAKERDKNRISLLTSSYI